MKKTLITLALTMVSAGAFAQMDSSNMNHDNMDHGKMDHGSMSMDNMNMGDMPMDHSKMDHSNMQGMVGMSAVVCQRMGRNRIKSSM